MAGAVLNALNYRLDARSIAFILEHGEAKLLIADREFAATVEHGAARARRAACRWSRSPTASQAAGRSARSNTRPSSRRAIPHSRRGRRREDEWERDRAELHLGHDRQPEGRRLSPSRRLSERARQRARPSGWTRQRSISGRCRCSTATAGPIPGRVTAVGGTHVCLRRVDPAPIFDAIADARVTHLCGAPIVLNMLVHAPDDGEAPLRPRGRGRDRRRGAALRRDRGDGARWASASPISTA